MIVAPVIYAINISPKALQSMLPWCTYLQTEVNVKKKKNTCLSHLCCYEMHEDFHKVFFFFTVFFVRSIQTYQLFTVLLWRPLVRSLKDWNSDITWNFTFLFLVPFLQLMGKGMVILKWLHTSGIPGCRATIVGNEDLAWSFWVQSH